MHRTVNPTHRSGRITLGSDGKTWVQHRRDGSFLEHADPVALIERKAEALRTWLEAEQGMSLPLGYVRSKVVLVNAKCEVDESLKKIPAVYHHEAVQFVCSDDLGWMNSMMTWLAGDMLANRSFRTLCQALARAPTWDVLHLEGGATLRGDWRGFHGEGAEPLAQFVTTRDKCEQVDVRHNRSLVVGAVGAVVGVTPRASVVAWSRQEGGGGWGGVFTGRPCLGKTHVPLDASVMFQQAGARTAQPHSINDVVRLDLSV